MNGAVQPAGTQVVVTITGPGSVAVVATTTSPGSLRSPAMSRWPSQPGPNAPVRRWEPGLHFTVVCTAATCRCRPVRAIASGAPPVRGRRTAWLVGDTCTITETDPPGRCTRWSSPSTASRSLPALQVIVTVASAARHVARLAWRRTTSPSSATRSRPTSRWPRSPPGRNAPAPGTNFTFTVSASAAPCRCLDPVATRFQRQPRLRSRARSPAPAWSASADQHRHPMRRVTGCTNVGSLDDLRSPCGTGAVQPQGPHVPRSSP